MRENLIEHAQHSNNHIYCMIHIADALRKTLGLTLVGPYDILAGKRAKPGKHPCYLTHYRYYYDPPEFLTVVKGDSSTQFHMGYFR